MKVLRSFPFCLGNFDFWTFSTRRGGSANMTWIPGSSTQWWRYLQRLTRVLQCFQLQCISLDAEGQIDGCKLTNKSRCKSTLPGPCLSKNILCNKHDNSEFCNHVQKALCNRGIPSLRPWYSYSKGWSPSQPLSVDIPLFLSTTIASCCGVWGTTQPMLDVGNLNPYLHSACLQDLYNKRWLL